MRQAIIIKDTWDPARPKYKINFESKRLIALSLLMDAINDDRDGSSTMDQSIISYYNEHLRIIYNDIQGSYSPILIHAEHINNVTVNGQDEKFPIRISEGSV